MSTIPSAADAATKKVLDKIFSDRQDFVIVPSPPGAGKTSLVEAVVTTAVKHLGWRVATVAPRVEQTYDLVRRIRDDYEDFRLELLHSQANTPPTDFTARGIICNNDAKEVASGAGLMVSTVAKMFDALPDIPGRFDLLVCDEAYQIPAKDLLPLYDKADHILLVGDPGQLRPIVKSDVARFEAASSKIHWPAPLELLGRHPELIQVPLPATWRLPQDTVDFVQPSFYPDLPFMSGAKNDERRLAFNVCGRGDAIDRALDRLAEGHSLVALTLPALQHEPEIDEELAELSANLLIRLLERQPIWNGKQLGPDSLGYVDAHVASNAAVQKHLRSGGVGTALQATTPEIWQGRERPIMVAKHTLSGMKRFGEFELEPGRLCVMTSRHKLGCIIVGRDGIGTALENHGHNCADWPSGAESLEWRGWLANREFWKRMESSDRVIKV